jgi:hypothetical protein
LNGGAGTDTINGGHGTDTCQGETLIACEWQVEVPLWGKVRLLTQQEGCTGVGEQASPRGHRQPAP